MNQELSLTQQELQENAKRIVRVARYQALGVSLVLIIPLQIGLDSVFKNHASGMSVGLTMPALVFAGLFAHYRVKNSPYYQGQPVRRFVTRTATTINQPIQEFKPPSQTWTLFGCSLFFFVAASLYWWSLRHSHPTDARDHLDWFGVFFFVAFGTYGFVLALRSLFPSSPALSFTPTGITGCLLQKEQHQISWNEISGCQIVEHRDFLGNPTYYELLFQDENGRLLSKACLGRAFSLSEQKRLVQTLESFLQSSPDSA